MQEYKPDYKKAMELADEVLICSLSTNGFPFSVIELIEEATDIQVHTFNYFRKNMLELKVFGSEDAILFQRDGRAMIAYDEKYPKTRIRFSVLHELGHYMLNHNKVNVINNGGQNKKPREWDPETGLNKNPFKKGKKGKK